MKNATLENYNKMYLFKWNEIFIFTKYIYILK